MTTRINDADLLTASEARRYLGVSEWRWRDLKAAGKLPRGVRVGGGRKPRYRRRDLDSWRASLPAFR